MGRSVRGEWGLNELGSGRGGAVGRGGTDAVAPLRVLVLRHREPLGGLVVHSLPSSLPLLL